MCGEYFSACQFPAQDLAEQPRIRGDYESTGARTYPQRGTTPHTRGIPFTIHGPHTVIGNNPAYAEDYTSRPGSS